MDYSMRIWLQPDKLAKYGITAKQVSSAIQGAELAVRSGALGDMPTPNTTELTWQIDTRGSLADA